MIEDYQGKVAVVTGAASGIGRAIAGRCCARGMKLVISDVETDALKKTEEELKATHDAVISVVSDVSRHEDIEELARQTIDTYGAVHLLCNNAGIATAGPIVSSTLKDYRWVIDVDLWGVIYGMTTFLPLMLEQGDHCHIVNTSSGAGITPSNAAYGVAKCGVSALSEMYALDLRAMNANVGVSALIPGIVNTNIVNSQRNRPEEVSNPEAPIDPKTRDAMMQRYEQIMQTYSGPQAMLPETVADIMFHGVENDAIYIFTDLADGVGVESRTAKMLSDLL